MAHPGSDNLIPFNERSKDEARELGKKVLLDKDLKWCEVQLSYAIGKDKPSGSKP